MVKTCFYICYEFGIHHVTIETSDTDFYKVIDELKKEFEIFISNDNIDGYQHSSYQIQNYYGDFQEVGFIIDKEIS